MDEKKYAKTKANRIYGEQKKYRRSLVLGQLILINEKYEKKHNGTDGVKIFSNKKREICKSKTFAQKADSFC